MNYNVVRDIRIIFFDVFKIEKKSCRPSWTESNDGPSRFMNQGIAANGLPSNENDDWIASQGHPNELDEPGCLIKAN